MIEPQESREAEQCVIGGMLRNEKAREVAFSVLVVDDFYHHDLQIIFKLLECWEKTHKGTPPDQVTVHQQLKDINLLEEVNSPQILADCISQTAPDYDISGCCRIVKEKSAKRQVVEACRNVAMSTTQTDADAGKVLDNARKILSNLQIALDPDSLTSLKQESQILLNELEEVTKTGKAPKLLFTGFKQLDDALDGIQTTEMTVLAALPGAGKSAFGLNVLSHLCGGAQGLAGGLISLEMDKQNYVRRLYAHEAVIPLQRFKRVMSEEELSAIRAAKKAVDGWELYIEDDRTVSIADLDKKMKNMVKLHHVDFIMIDYFQLLHNDTRQNTYQFLCQASQTIFNFTREMRVPVLVLAQTNRGMLQKDTEPNVSHIEGCPKILQDADKGGILKWTSKQNEQGVATVDFHLLKNRSGPTYRVIPFEFDGKFCRFSEMKHNF